MFDFHYFFRRNCMKQNVDLIIHYVVMWEMFRHGLEPLVMLDFSDWIENRFYSKINCFKIDIGSERQIFSEQNVPLEGVQSALGRSIVIFGPNYSPEIFSCANIEPDHDIIKYINLQRPPKFVVYVRRTLLSERIGQTYNFLFFYVSELSS